ncbi:IclR family transcriptional regulator [Bordetella tumulicola]|uniref:IclR family transcriptional regulator n=1 Tax=Bordetella tumulicola TaxID=1649133 RepID=UPI0039EFF512
MSAPTEKNRNVNVITLPGLVNPHDLSSDRQFSMNLARGLEVLRAFSASTPLLGNREIADRTGLAKPTVSRLTYTLTLLGYLARDPKLQKYRLGPGVLSLGHPLLASMQVRQLAKPLMESLARATGCTVNLGIRDRGNVVYIDSVRADSANQHLPDIGTSRPLLLSSIGRALILAYPATERTAILNYLKVQNPQDFEQCRAFWEADVKRFTAYGYCHSQGDWQKDIHAVAVPIRQRPDEPPLAMNCTIAAHRAQKDRLVHEVIPLLKESVHQLEFSQGLH